MGRTALVFVIAAGGVSPFLQEVGSAGSAARYTEALRILQRGDSERSLSILKVVLSQDPGFDRAYAKILEIEENLGRREAALDYFHTLMTQSPPNPYACYGLALAHGNAWRARKEPEELRAAEKSLRTCIEAVPDFAPAYLAWVDLAADRDELSQVTEVLERLLTSDAQNAALWYGMGYARETSLDLSAAREAYERSLALQPDLWFAQMGLYGIHYRIDRLQALSFLISLRDRLSRDDVERHGRIIGRMGNLHMDLADYSQALTYLEESVALAREVGDRRAEQAFLSSQGIICRALGRLPQALEVYRESLRVARQIADRQTEGRLLALSGFIHMDAGDYGEALRVFTDSLTLARETGDRSSEADQLSSLSSVYTALGDYPRALDYVENGVKVVRELKDPRSEGRYLLILGRAREDVGDIEGATAAYEQAAALASGIKDRVTEATSLSSIGRLHAKSGNLVEGGRRTEIALGIADEIGAAALSARILDDLGRLRLAMGEDDRAEDAFNRSLGIAESIRLPELAWRAQAGRAQIHERRKSTAEAVARYREAVAIIESVRGRLALAEDRAGFFQDKVDVYRRLVALQVSAHETDPTGGALSEALRYAERARARAFLDLLAEAKVDSGSVTMSASTGRRRELEGQMAQIHSALIQAHGSPALDKKRMQALEANLAKADEQYRALEREMRREEPQYAALRYPEAAGLAEAQSLLDENSVLLSYSLGQEASFLFAVTRTDARVARLPGDATLAERVRRLRNAIAQPSRATLPAYVAAARELYQDLVAPAEPLLEGRKELVVIPEGALYYLPFEVLLTRNVTVTNPRELPYLVRDVTVSYVPSASVLATLRERHRTSATERRALVAFGDPVYAEDGLRAPSAVDFAERTLDAEKPWRLQRLEQSSAEIERIGRLFPEKERTLFLRGEATEDAVKSGFLNQYRYVHFATHGLLNERRPQFSGLVLTLPRLSDGGSRRHEDGLLQVYEVFNLKLDADLVVLSACETGLGKEVNGEGVVGLTRAFLYAGTPRVIVSLWKVADRSTADLMVRFYEHLKDGGASPAQALRRSRLDLIQNGPFAHPYFWAPFVLVGKS